MSALVFLFSFFSLLGCSGVTGGAAASAENDFSPAENSAQEQGASSNEADASAGDREDLGGAEERRDSASEPEEQGAVSPVREGFVSISELIQENRAKRRYGIAISDYNRDGDFEAIVTGYGGANEVLDWRAGELVQIADPVIADPERRAIGVAACDLTGDGVEEIYFLNIDRFGEAVGRIFSRHPKTARQ